ncbi:SPATA1_C domain-containing protein [Caerostris extrusa]|uniref:SPATA1_C domain-containing protein n=1 Tax=Caerostris extrusa TaxID=172846 RepID=A0AAV4Y1E6_CAEEX|nr:SPATA1_C domain-containing protein [Caerostris extrusa]
MTTPRTTQFKCVDLLAGSNEGRHTLFLISNSNEGCYSILQELVIPSTTLLELRGDIREQLGGENVPGAFVFLRSVGISRKENSLQSTIQVLQSTMQYEFGLAKWSTSERGRKEDMALHYKIIKRQKGQIEARTRAQSEKLSSTLRRRARDLREGGRVQPIRSASLGAESRSTHQKNSGTPTTSSSESQAEVSSVRRPRRSSMTTVRRPPTPRVTERFFTKTNKFRSSSIASIKMKESIRESPTELIEETRTPLENLKVEEDSERVFSSPPPRPQSENSKRTPEEDIKIPVPTPTPQDLGEDSPPLLKQIMKLKILKKCNCFPTTKKKKKNRTKRFIEEQDSAENVPTRQDPRAHLVDCSELLFGHTQMGNEDVIVDPISCSRAKANRRMGGERQGSFRRRFPQRRVGGLRGGTATASRHSEAWA